MSETSNEDSVKLQLGDIIQIEAPNDEMIHKKQYIIEYIDTELIRLIGEDNEFEISILENGILDNETITSIQIISRSDTPSYARQNKLLPKTWIYILFEDTKLKSITGQIKNIREDMR